MRRTKWRGTILFVIILTVMGATAGLRLYGVGTETTAASSGATTVSGPATASAAPSASATPTPTQTSTDAASPTPTPTATAAAPAATQKVVDGAVENTRFGPVQVQVTFSGSQITAVKTLQVPSGGRSDEINSYAAPQLAQEVMSSQSANIDTVSGATYTSEAYSQSVQSAIDHK